METVPASIALVAEAAGVDLSPLGTTVAFTAAKVADFREALRGEFPVAENTHVDVVVCGSFGRGELTAGSDCDYLVLVDGQVEPQKVPLFSQQMSKLCHEHGLEGPGQTGLFGDFSVTADLLGRIGLEGDSYTNTTRRMLVLTESESVYQPSVRQHVVSELIKRYCFDYREQDTGWNYGRVPRFMLNDLLRYWRTIAVDFAAKRWRDSTSGPLRRAKLRVSRKVLFAGSLAPILLVSQHPLNDTPAFEGMCAFLDQAFMQSPLARLMSLYDVVDSASKTALGQVLGAYCSFLEVLDDPSSRNALKTGRDIPEALTDRLAACEGAVQSGLVQIFFRDPVFQPLTEKYGLF